MSGRATAALAFAAAFVLAQIASATDDSTIGWQAVAAVAAGLVIIYMPQNGGQK
jgi:peptidoglycan/LPS O-acetylase OafA/YrhL